MSANVGELFDAGSTGFCTWSPRLWEPLGEALVRIAAPRAGERVLDACCGTGASALPAAVAVGPSGWVDGVDLAERLLDHARRTAADSGLGNVRFSRADATMWASDSGPYDLVQCGYGVHLLADMTVGGRQFASLLRPGGRFAMATGAVGVFEPLLSALDTAVAHERNDRKNPVSGPRPSDELNTPDKLAGYLDSIGLTAPEVTLVAMRVALDDPQSTWALVTGSALRYLLTGLASDALARVRAEVLAHVHRRSGAELNVPTLVGVGHKPG